MWCRNYICDADTYLLIPTQCPFHNVNKLTTLNVMNISLIYIIDFLLAQLSVMVSSLDPSTVLVTYRYIILYACMLVMDIDYYIISMWQEPTVTTVTVKHANLHHQIGESLAESHGSHKVMHSRDFMWDDQAVGHKSHAVPQCFGSVFESHGTNPSIIAPGHRCWP